MHSGSQRTRLRTTTVPEEYSAEIVTQNVVRRPRMTLAIRRLAYPALAISALGLVFESSGLDLIMSDLFYDFPAGHWLYKDSWWANALIHTAGVRLVVLIGLTGLLTWIHSTVTRRESIWNCTALYLFLAIGASTAIVAGVQSMSSTPCPRSTPRYANVSSAAADEAQCWPSKHASAGFSLLALYFVFERRSRRWSWLGLGVGMSLGAVFSFGQVVRGAHFVSHCLWSAAICWVVVAGLASLMLGSGESSPQATATAATRDSLLTND